MQIQKDKVMNHVEIKTEKCSIGIYGGQHNGLFPGRYTNYGIAYMRIQACYTADEMARRNKFNETRITDISRNLWESNVARRGYFLGYEGSVGMTDEDRRLFIVGGKNIPKEKAR